MSSSTKFCLGGLSRCSTPITFYACGSNICGMQTATHMLKVREQRARALCSEPEPKHCKCVGRLNRNESSFSLVPAHTAASQRSSEHTGPKKTSMQVRIPYRPSAASPLAICSRQSCTIASGVGRFCVVHNANTAPEAC